MATIWKVTNLSVSRLSDTQVIARWKFNTGTTTDSFELWWEWWSSARKVWVVDNKVTVPLGQHEQGYFQATWSPPSDPSATSVMAWVRPWATKDANGKYKWSSGGQYSSSIPNPAWQAAHSEALAAPSLSAQWDSLGRIGLSWGNAPALATKVNIYQSVDGAAFRLLKTLASSTAQPWPTKPADGHTYAFQARWCLSDGKTLGAASAATATFRARPLAPTELSARAVSSTSVRVDWKDRGASGDSWRVEWSDDAAAWDNHAEVSSRTHEVAPDSQGRNWATVDGLETGTAYWFRVLRVESGAPEEHRESAYATSGKALQVRCVTGTVPAAPSLGLVPSCAPADEPLALSWTHNSEDGSVQTAYQLDVEGTVTEGTAASRASVTPSSYGVSDGGELEWRVRTKGAVEQWSPWSVTGTVMIWAKPVATIAVEQSVDAYPLEVSLVAGSTAVANEPTRFWLAVEATEGYETMLADGTTRWVAAGESVWSGEAAVGEEGCTVDGWELSLGAQDVRLEPGQTYTVRGGCMTAQGMVGEAEPADFTSDLASSDLSGCDCEAELDEGTLAATIAPTCKDGPDGEFRAGVTLSVWRATPEGCELVGSGLPNDGTATCVDRHPSFGTCTYRVVATDGETGSQGFSDAVFEWEAPGIVIQWDERWDEPSSDMDGLSLSCERLVLPYDVKVTDSWAKESSLNEWAGRRHPVSRYGTQAGHTSTWSFVLAGDDGIGQLQGLRALAAHMGDVHVREPWGSSYWAHVQVTQAEASHDRAYYPCQLAVTMVEV